MKSCSALNNQPYDERNAKAHQYKAINAVQQMNIAGCKPGTDLIRQHYFCNVCSQNDQQGRYKNNEAFIDGMCNKGGGCGEPENKNAGVQRIQKKS